MKLNRQYGFTMIELLVVIAIIGLLAAALIANMSSGLEAGRKLKCMANLRSLAQAVTGDAITQHDDDESTPNAGSYEYSHHYLDEETGEEKFTFHSSRAWVSWVPSSLKWPYPSSESQAGNMKKSSFYEGRGIKNSAAFFSITNGVLWSRVGKDASVYLCETHKIGVENRLRAKIYRSFVMNRHFGFDADDYRRGASIGKIEMSGRASIRLLLTELPIKSSYNDAEKDSVLDPDNNEALGFNHKVGNKWVANVVFADCHVEGIVRPTGASTAELKDLTTQLCNGSEIDAKLRVKMQ